MIFISRSLLIPHAIAHYLSPSLLARTCGWMVRSLECHSFPQSVAAGKTRGRKNDHCTSKEACRTFYIISSQSLPTCGV
ncbi:hypothetical protein BX600DRAFT_460426 [Xylariales sp. PMI_506]|nr:hypothetical protein BX600DRAFT_460426 [Xylariales sp. PMI_506]